MGSRRRPKRLSAVPGVQRDKTQLAERLPPSDKTQNQTVPTEAQADSESAQSASGSAQSASGNDRIDFARGFWKSLAVICGIALLLRLLNVFQTFQVPTSAQLMGDAAGYFAWATEIADGNWLGDETFYQAPLYPYFLALLVKVFGIGVTGLRVAQAVLGSLGVAAIGIATRKLVDQRTGLIAAAMLTLYPPAIFYDGIIQKAALASALLCGFLLACAYFQASFQKSTAILAGITLGLLMLTRENALLWLPLIPAWMLFRFPETPLRTRLVAACLFGLGVAVVLFPVAARNASFGGEWSPTTFQAGPNFYIGNNLQANGVYTPLVAGHGIPGFERADAERLAQEEAGRELTPREVSQFWMSKAWQEIRQAPLQWLQLMGIKLLMTVNRFEVPDVESLQVYRESSLPLRLLTPLWHFGVLAPLAVWGLVISRDQWRTWSLSYLLILSMGAAIAGFFILGRYRLPLVPLLLPFAAMAAVHIVAVVRQRRWRQAISPAICTALAAVICNLPIHDEANLQAGSFMNAGAAAGEAGNLPTAIYWLERSLEQQPASATARFNLGRAYSLTNRPLEAIEQFQMAQQLNPTLISVDYFMACVLESIGQRKAALHHYERALQIDPLDEDSRQAAQRLRTP